MKNSKSLFAAFIALTSSWLAMSILVDFFVVPTVFRNIDDFFLAGDLGIALFGKFNQVEVILASTLISITALRARLSHLFISIGLWIIAMTYFLYLSPMIQTLTELWKKADEMGLVAIAGIADIQLEHQRYHKAYIFIDTIKMGLLLFLLGLGIYKEKRWS
jgi:hypothetical protein